MVTLGQGRLELGCRTSLRHTNSTKRTRLRGAVSASAGGLNQVSGHAAGCGSHLRPEHAPC